MTTTPEYQNLELRKQGHTAVVTFNRPAKANALDHALLLDVEAVALGFRDDAETRVVVFTGAGRHFSSGADLDGGDPPAAGLLARRRLARMGERATLAIQNLDQISIAAWNGAAMGGGAVLATAMDLRIGASDCFMQYPEIDIGVNLMWQGLPLITHIAGPSRAKRLVIGGERVHGPELLEWGILDALAPPAALLDTALDWAARYAGKSPIAAQMIKRSINVLVAALDGAVMHMDVDQHLLAAATEDRAAAVHAYRTGGEPSFKGD